MKLPGDEGKNQRTHFGFGTARDRRADDQTLHSGSPPVCPVRKGCARQIAHQCQGQVAEQEASGDGEKDRQDDSRVHEQHQEGRG